MLVHLTIKFRILFIVLLFITGCSVTPPGEPIGNPTGNTVIEAQEFTLSEARYGHSVANDGEKIYVFGGTTSSGFSGDIEIIDPQTQKSQILKNKLIPRRYFSAVWDGKESVYIIGGMSLEGRRPFLQSAVEVFNTRTHEVTQAPSHIRATRMNTAVYLDDKIYVFGGATAGAGLRKGLKHVAWVSVYDTRTHQWTESDDMPVAFASEAVIYNNAIYLAGGFNGRKQFKTFYEFMPGSSQWRELTSLPIETSAHCMTIIKNNLYTFGNYDELEQTLRYNFDTGLWSNANLPLLPRRHAASTTLGNDIYVIGGTVSRIDLYVDSVQVFSF
ncbi:MAG: kelch repeat-containing protein [Pseudomonadota bacterium]|nr:kelch repeat-containing protein [Pseudomonadota bacterium]